MTANSTGQPALQASAANRQAQRPQTRTERRSSERHLTVLRVALLTTGDFQGLCIVRNVSTGGMMLETHRALKTGQSLSVSLVDQQPVHGAVVWVNGTTAGVKFEAQTPIDRILSKPASLPGGRQPRPPRFRTDIPAIIETIAGAAGVRIEDVSSRGAKVLMEKGRLPAGTEVIVRLPGATPVKAATRWSRGSSAGIEFFHPLPVRDLLAWLPS